MQTFKTGRQKEFSNIAELSVINVLGLRAIVLPHVKHAKPMMDSEVLDKDVCLRVIQQLRKIHVDLLLLTEKYVEAHGLHSLTHYDLPGGNSSMDSATWAEMAMEERLLANITAYFDFERRLMSVIEEQGDSLLQGEDDLHSSLHSILAQVSALRSQLEYLGTEMGLEKTLEEGVDEMDSAVGGIFDRKVRGYHVLRELAIWAVRSIRDLRKLHRERGNLAIKTVRSTETSEQ
ncbi:ciliary neurotrophic factor isoform 2-T2 [Anomaloglossus baeobatrachus]|uniref:ciliary neurotrophic factor isoform X2 n=1 Tax=Anomaloglossus baeobatrachus TaxID=238106 RepID=UPI003F508896